MINDYQFLTSWSFKAPISDIWHEISHPGQWSEWWRGVTQVQLIQKGDENDLGTIRRFTFRSKLPYNLTFDMKTTANILHERLEGDAFGELEGKGIWTFRQDAEVTQVQYVWTVKTTKAWMNWLAPVAKPFFKWNHDVIMRWGYEGLCQKLGILPDSYHPDKQVS